MQISGLMLGQISEASKATIREIDSGAAAIIAEDPLMLLRAIILTHLSDPRLGADQNLLRVRMVYETVKTEFNDVLKFYYQRFKELKAGYEDTMRAWGLCTNIGAKVSPHQVCHLVYSQAVLPVVPCILIIRVFGIDHDLIRYTPLCSDGNNLMDCIVACPTL